MQCSVKSIEPTNGIGLAEPGDVLEVRLQVAGGQPGCEGLTGAEEVREPGMAHAFDEGGSRPVELSSVWFGGQLVTGQDDARAHSLRSEVGVRLLP